MKRRRGRARLPTPKQKLSLLRDLRSLTRACHLSPLDAEYLTTEAISLSCFSHSIEAQTRRRARLASLLQSYLQEHYRLRVPQSRIRMLLVAHQDHSPTVISRLLSFRKET